MRNITYNAETGETTVEEVPDVEMPIVEEVPVKTAEQRISELETLVLQMGGII